MLLSASSDFKDGSLANLGLRSFLRFYDETISFALDIRRLESRERHNKLFTTSISNRLAEFAESTSRTDAVLFICLRSRRIAKALIESTANTWIITYQNYWAGDVSREPIRSLPKRNIPDYELWRREPAPVGFPMRLSTAAGAQHSSGKAKVLSK